LKQYFRIYTSISHKIYQIPFKVETKHSRNDVTISADFTAYCGGGLWNPNNNLKFDITAI